MWRLRSQHQTKTVVVKSACNTRYAERKKKKWNDIDEQSLADLYAG